MDDVHHLERSGVSRAVVTGAAGFIGSHLVDALLGAGVEVFGVDNFDPWYSAEQKRSNLAAAAGCPRFDLIETDITTRDLPDVFCGADVVFHLAGRPGVQDSWGAGFEATAAVNVIGTQAVLEAALVAGVGRVVAASSSSVYGDHAVPGAGRAVRPVSPYGVSKLAAEQLAAVYLARGLDVVNLRYFTVYGARQRPDMAFHRLFRSALPGGAVFTRRGGGEQRREFTHVSDVVAATIAAAAADGIAGRALDVGGGSAASLNDVIGLVTDLVGAVPRMLDVERPAGDPHQTTAATEDTRRLLGWAPRVDLPAGLADQLAWHHGVAARQAAPRVNA